MPHEKEPTTDSSDAQVKQNDTKVDSVRASVDKSEAQGVRSKGLTRSDVAQAMATLESQGRKTSLREIRNVLQRGSNSTIVKHRQAILVEYVQKESAIPESCEVSELAGKLADITKPYFDTLLLEAHKMADRKIALTEASCTKQIKLAEARKEKAITLERESQVRYTNVKQQLRLQRKNTVELEKKLTSITREKNKLEEQLLDANRNFVESQSDLVTEITVLHQTCEKARVDLESTKQELDNSKEEFKREVGKLMEKNRELEEQNI